jgi:hypothetical protein
MRAARLSSDQPPAKPEPGLLKWRAQLIASAADSEFLGVVTTSPELRRQVAQTGPPDELTLTLNVA